MPECLSAQNTLRTRVRLRTAFPTGAPAAPVGAPVPFLCREPLLPVRRIWFNGHMARHQNTSTGRFDLEPFWPSRQHHDFDRVCCRATQAPAL